MSTIFSNAYWLKNNKTCDNFWNDNAGGLGVTTLLPVVGGSVSMESKVDWANGAILPADQYGYNRAEIKQKMPDALDRFYAFSVTLKNFKFETKKNFLVAQWKPGDNYPTLSLWVKENAGAYYFTLVRKCNIVDGGNFENEKTLPNIKTYITQLVPVVSDKKFSFAFDVNWAADPTGNVDIFLNGSLLKRVPGPNMDKLLPKAKIAQNFRCGLYVFSNARTGIKPKYPIKIGWFENVNVGNSADSKLADFL